MNLTFGPDAPILLQALAAAALVGHIAGGALGMIAGGAAMFAPKGGRAHQVAGTIFFVAMLGMAGIAAIVAPVLDEARWTNTTAAVFTLYLVATAWATVRRPPGRAGRFERTIVWVPVGIAGLGGLLAVAGAAVPRPEDFAVIYVFAVISAGAALADLRMIRQGGLRGVSRVARHVWRMSAALFMATGSFFFGQADVLPPGLRASAVPAVLGLAPLALMAFWLVRIRLAPRRAPRAVAA